MLDLVTPKKYTSKDVRKTFSHEKENDEKHNQWIIYTIYRPFSFIASAFLLNLGITPNQLGSVSLLFCMGLPLTHLFSAEVAFIILAISICILYLLDCIDGDMARASGNVSVIGHYLDFITDVIFRISAYLAIVLIIYNNPEYTQNNFYWAYCLAAAWLTTAARLSRIFVQRLQRTDAEIYSRTNKKTYSSFDRIFFVISSLDQVLPYLILSMVFFSSIDWLVWWIFTYAVVDFVFTQYLIFKGLR